MTMMCVCVLNREEERHNPENRSFQMHVEGGQFLAEGAQGKDSDS